jgi:hypothetical protein
VPEILGKPIPQPDEGTTYNRHAGAVGSQTTSGVIALKKRTEKTRKDAGVETTDPDVTNGSQ